ncbi:hypothetical protein HDU92_003847 [Lobulomyces angularis]|nr:hypothetical protein HDU92_003847 [Lobulomyces angularis]
MIDQLFFTWIYTIAFYSWLNFNNGGSLDFDIVVSTVKAAWTIWPIAMILIFTFVPSKLRLLAANFVGFGWGMYQSMLLEGL